MRSSSAKTSIKIFTILFLLFPFATQNLIYFSIDSQSISFSEKLNTSQTYSEIDLSFLPEIDYATLNDIWYNPEIEMLIITPNLTDFINAVKPLADWKNEKGVKTIILSNFTKYPGRDDAESIRNMIKSYYVKENIQWVLLVGDAQEDLIPIREVYNPDVLRWGDGKTETVGGEYYKPTDYYYADLTGTWDSDNDARYGEAPQDNSYNMDEISWIPEVYVGRLPADTFQELEIMVNKTLNYEINPNIGDWMNKMILAGGVSSYNPQEYESRLTSYIVENYLNTEINFIHLVEEEGSLTQDALRYYFNIGSSTVLMAGHGAPTTYYRNPSQAGYTSNDAATSSNFNMPSLVYIDACTTSSYDYNDNSIGETLIKQLNAGAVGAIGALRVTWYFDGDINLEKLNRGNAKLFWKEFFVEKKFQQGRALYDSKVSYLNSDYYQRGEGSTVYDFERKNLLTYCLLGDPELDIYTDIPKEAFNPFTQDIYEGQLVSITLKNIDNVIVPYARVHLETNDGKYHTIYADKFGIAEFRVPAQANETYNVTITGHNLIPSYFNFTTLPDNTAPNIHEASYTPKKPSVSDNICFNIKTNDSESGIESVYLLISENNFSDFTDYRVSNDFQENTDEFEFIIDKLKPGNYDYLFIMRDYANNTNIFYDSTYNLILAKPVVDYILIVSLIAIMVIAVISLVMIYKGIKNHSINTKRIEEENLNNLDK